MIELSEFVLETVREDGELALHRGRREKEPSAILVLAPVSKYPALGTLERLEHEYSLRDELGPGWAVRPLALNHHEGRMVLVLEDPGGTPLHRLVGQPMELSQFLRIAVGLITAVGRLHEQGLIHKDIKPANVLVDIASGDAWLMGFGIASPLPRQRQAPEPPEVIAGTLAYMAPEQTGRMNRSIDSRSDLYSVGVTLYEMLTGVLPFTAADPMEWVHCHIARRPVPLEGQALEVPGTIVAIIMKLLAKTAEERYQTAFGLKSDLKRCQDEWESRGLIDPFPLGAHDTSNRLLVPEKLYGRKSEIDTLVAAFERVVAHGTLELVVVSGYSGIGKSSIVYELHKVLVPPGGLFAAGKFDQFKRDIPYTTLAQAFQSLVRQILGKHDAEVSRWRDALQEALGMDGQLMVGLIPELELIIGEQPPVAELSHRMRRTAFKWYSCGSSASSPMRSTRWRCFLMICNGWIWRLSNCSSAWPPKLKPITCCWSVPTAIMKSNPHMHWLGRWNRSVSLAPKCRKLSWRRFRSWTLISLFRLPSLWVSPSPAACAANP